MRTTEMDHLRGVVQGLSEGGKKPISNALVFGALALDTEDEKARVRRSLNGMVQRKELRRTKPGHYEYNPKSQARRSGEGYIRMWRAVRASNGQFLLSEISAVAHINASTVSKYVKHLVEAGFVRRNGKKGTSYLFTTTSEGRERRETPYPPREPRDPHASERAAMSRLSRIFFEKDLYSETARKAVLKECHIILARFDKQDEKGGENV